MKWITQLPLATKLGAAFCSVLVLTVIVGAFSVFELAQVNATSNMLSSHWMPSIRVIEDIKSQVARIRTRELQYIISTDIAEMDKYDAVIAKDLVDLQKMQTEFETLLGTGPDREMYTQFTALWARYLTEDAKIRAASRANDEKLEKSLIRGESNKLIVAMRAQVDHLVDFYSDGGKAAAVEGHIRYTSSRFWIIALVLGSVLAGAVGAFLITRWLMRSLGGEPTYATGIVGQIAAGDLSVEINTAKNDVSSLLFAMKTMRNSLSEIVGNVRESTHVITSASVQITAGNLDLSSRTEQQASSLEETAASMEELTSTVRSNSDSAAEANEFAISVSKIANKGSEVVGRVVDTMDSINTASRRIADITAVIDGIAFQTNILALNAAVEAARAGEQGRGFAVVASEVRTLAQRSAGAAKEIKELIANSVEQVNSGSKLASEAGMTMKEVVTSVQRVTGLIAEITNAGKEQSLGIEQVNQAIAQMDTVTQQNAELVQQATSAAQSMQLQATSLSHLVSVFVLKTHPETQIRPQLPSAAPRKHPALA